MSASGFDGTGRHRPHASGVLALGTVLAVVTVWAAGAVPTGGPADASALTTSPPSAGLRAGEPSAPGPASARPGTPAAAADCVRCHTCALPTPAERCLAPCTRPQPRTPRTPDRMGPDSVLIRELENLYWPVPFDHRGHARMAEMARGCVTCHHNTPAGQEPPACKTCHSPTDPGTDITKPSLKGAYHRQCLNCHKDWTAETDCAKCHPLKTDTARAALPPSRDDLLALLHPPIPQPETDVYRVGAAGASATVVVFRHQEHVQRFGLTCAECHHEESCSRCHAADAKPKEVRTLAEHHRPCEICHRGDMEGDPTQIVGKCERCHWRAEQPKPEPFDHARTGWPLSRYHQTVGCRKCHPAVPFAKRDRDCNACHAAWEPGKFNHAVTGQTLDENHADADCQTCHAERKFDRPPTCGECHDKDSGITFPDRRPGPKEEPPATKPAPTAPPQ